MANFGARDRRYRRLVNKSGDPNSWRLQLALPQGARRSWERLCAEWGQPPRVVFLALLEAMDKDAELRGEISKIFEKQRWETLWTSWGETPSDTTNNQNGDRNA